MNLRFSILAAAVVLCCCTSHNGANNNSEHGGDYVAGSGDVTIGTLLDEMVDRNTAAQYPKADYRSKQFSSYDRSSTVKDGEGWYNNDDNSKFLRYEQTDLRTEYVMFDAKGPGAIVRWWMTFAGENCGTGIIRVYIDGNEKPVITGKAFDVLSGGRVTKGCLGTSVSDLTPYEQRGHNLYYPIPYAKSCKITYESKNISYDQSGKISSTEAVYYNINYRTYNSHTKVVSYSADEAEFYAPKAREVEQMLTNVSEPATKESISMDGELAAGQSASCTIKGENAIKLIKMRLWADNIEQALRSTILSIAFDGNQTVWVPVGEFFRVGYKQLDMHSWYINSSSDGLMSAYWVMPFNSEATVTITNTGKESVKISDSQVGYEKYDFNNRTMHFGADWHQYSAVDTRTSPLTGKSGSVYDINFTTLKGKGVYMGDGVTLFNTTAAWWGEGDEKVYVDSESFPSHFGTGSEDYYGYAWCRPEPFTGHPFIAQSDGSGDLTPGYTTNTRLRDLDGITFQQQLVFDMELWHWAQCTINYAVTTFHYMLPGGTSIYGEDCVAAGLKVAKSPIDLLGMEEQGFDLEAEYMTLDNLTGGKYEIQTAFADKWSRGCQVFWSVAPASAEMTLGFDSPYQGNYRLDILYARSWDYGKFDVWFNDTKLESNIDLNNATVTTEEHHYESVELKKGKNTLRVKVKGFGSGQSSAFFGVDRLRFTKQ